MVLWSQISGVAEVVGKCVSIWDKLFTLCVRPAFPLWGDRGVLWRKVQERCRGGSELPQNSQRAFLIHVGYGAFDPQRDTKHQPGIYDSRNERALGYGHLDLRPEFWF